MEKFEKVDLESDVRDGVKIDLSIFESFVEKLTEKINRDASSKLVDRKHFSIAISHFVRCIQRRVLIRLKTKTQLNVRNWALSNLCYATKIALN